MGRRATVVIPPPTKSKNDPTSAEAGADFKAIMKDTSGPSKDKRADQAARAERAEGSAQTQKERPGEQVTAAEEAGASQSDDLPSGDDVAAAESTGDGEGSSDSESGAVLPEVLIESVHSEEILALLTEGVSEVAQPVLSTAPIAKDQLPDLPETAEPLPEVTAQVAVTVEASAVDEAVGSAVAFATAEAVPTEAVVMAQGSTKPGLQKMVAPVRAESQGRGPVMAEINPALLGDEAVLATEDGQLADSEVLELVSETLDDRLVETGRPSTAPRVRATAAPGLATPPQANIETAPQTSSRIPTGLESVDRGAAEQDPLEGSVKINGVRGARIAVPMDDGTMLRGRLDLVDDALDVAIRASEDMGLRADQRVGELREALAEHGIDLGEFDVSADADQNEATGEGEDGTGSEGSNGSSSDRDSSPVRDLQEELEELRNENGFGYYDEGNPGALINRSL